ncbi:MAG: hypothetical protein QM621_03660 [Aeromicrobium sp.]|uniref:hypothetical protein n=1 Tax=Aeromicrobium sp. TaxID=1871063 RepID=UPI0039E2715F
MNNTSVRLLSESVDAERYGELLGLIEAHGVAVSPWDGDDLPDDSTVLVLLTDALFDRPDLDDVERRLREHAAQIIPVCYTDDPRGFLDDLSQLFVAELGVPEVARRVALVARVSGAALTAWGRVVLQAREWSVREAPELLLDASETQAVSLLLSQPIAEEDAEATSVVRRFVTESQSASRRQRRRWSQRVVAIATVAALIAVGAIVATVGAVVSWREAEQTGQESLASRLTRQATQLLPNDPDLPLILVEHAVEADPSDAVVLAARQTVARTTPHVTYELPNAPLAVGGARDEGIVAVAYLEGEKIDLVDVDSGKTTTWQGSFGQRRPSLFLAPDGESLAVVTDENRELFVDGESVGWPEDLGDAKLIDWWDDRSLMMVVGRSVVRYDVDDEQAETVVADLGIDLASVGAVDFEPTRQTVVVAGPETVQLFEGETGEKVGEALIPEVVRVVLDETNGALLAASQRRGVTYLATRSFTGWADAEISIATTAMEDFQRHPGSGFVRENTGRLGMIASGWATPQNATSAHSSDQMHSDELGGGRVVTAGLDRRLRAWDYTARHAPDLGAPERGPQVYDEMIEATLRNSTRLRPMPCEGDDRMSYISTRGVAVVDGVSLDAVGEVYLDPDPEQSWYRQVVLSPDGSQGLVIAGDGVAAALELDCDGVTTTELSPPDWMNRRTQGAMWALSDDGRYLAMADDEMGVVVREVDGWEEVGSWTDQTPGDPLGLTVTDGRVRMLTADGLWSSSWEEPTEITREQWSSIDGLEDDPVEQVTMTGEDRGCAMTREGRELVVDGSQLTVERESSDPRPADVRSADERAMTELAEEMFTDSGLVEADREWIDCHGSQTARLRDGWMSVLDPTTGQETLVVQQPDASSVAVFGGSQVAVVAHTDGTLSRRALQDAEAFIEGSRSFAPRSATELEREQYALEGGADHD